MVTLATNRPLYSFKPEDANKACLPCHEERVKKVSEATYVDNGLALLLKRVEELERRPQQAAPCEPEEPC